jgi:hypothetical protein
MMNEAARRAFAIAAGGSLGNRWWRPGATVGGTVGGTAGQQLAGTRQRAPKNNHSLPVQRSRIWFLNARPATAWAPPLHLQAGRATTTVPWNTLFSDGDLWAVWTGMSISCAQTNIATRHAGNEVSSSSSPSSPGRGAGSLSSRRVDGVRRWILLFLDVLSRLPANQPRLVSRAHARSLSRPLCLPLPLPCPQRARSRRQLQKPNKPLCVCASASVPQAPVPDSPNQQAPPSSTTRPPRAAVFARHPSRPSLLCSLPAPDVCHQRHPFLSRLSLACARGLH